jgi:beta-lactamase superfamily II metal-dependent hydrolase
MWRRWCVVAAALAALGGAARTAKTLDIFFIDVEGGQSTLVVTPAGESLLIDTGFRATDFTDTTTNRGRDARRIVSAARSAGLTHIDYLLITHFHGDHDGGVADVALQMPIRTFIDHGGVHADAESVPGTLEAFDAYAAVRAAGSHLEPKPGDRLPLRGIDAVVVSADRTVLAQPLPGARGPNAACAGAPALPAQEVHENPRSTGVVLTYGAFRFLDVGDLSGPPLRGLACPDDKIGPIDAYLVAHHGGPDAADAATFAAFRPRVAIVNNGPAKGGAPELFALLHRLPSVDAWQLHRSENPRVANFADDRIANLDDRTADWLKLAASPDGSFAITNGRTGRTTRYARHTP